jgi:hypothetical protein
VNVNRNVGALPDLPTAIPAWLPKTLAVAPSVVTLTLVALPAVTLADPGASMVAKAGTAPKNRMTTTAGIKRART